MIRTCDPLIRSQVLYPAELRVRKIKHLHQFIRRIECMTTLFEQFLKERTYIKNVSQKTLDFYRSSFKAYQKIMDSATLPIKQDLTKFVTGTREQGMKPVTCNTYIRGINSFLTLLAISRAISNNKNKGQRPVALSKSHLSQDIEPSGRHLLKYAKRQQTTSVSTTG